jgi:hypothetical protein
MGCTEFTRQLPCGWLALGYTAYLPRMVEQLFLCRLVMSMPRIGHIHTSTLRNASKQPPSAEGLFVNRRIWARWNICHEEVTTYQWLHVQCQRRGASLPHTPMANQMFMNAFPSSTNWDIGSINPWSFTDELQWLSCSLSVYHSIALSPSGSLLNYCVKFTTFTGTVSALKILVLYVKVSGLCMVSILVVNQVFTAPLADMIQIDCPQVWIQSQLWAVDNSANDLPIL